MRRKDKLSELIEELEHNAKINREKGLENRVDIDYILEKLIDINNNYYKIYLENAVFDTLDNLIESYDYFNLTEEEKNSLEELTYENVKNVVQDIYWDDYANDSLYECIRESLLKEIE